MTYDELDHCFVLSTGRKLHGNGPYRLSLDPPDPFFDRHRTSPKRCLDYGYDGQASDVYSPDEDETPLTDAERAEIARYMIIAWNRWAKTGSP